MNFQKVTKNILNLITGRIVIMLLHLLITVYLTRYFGITEFGKYNLVYTYLFFFTSALISGINGILVREISRNNAKAPELIGNALILCSMLSIILIFLSWIILIPLNYPDEIRNFIYIASAAIFFSSIGIIYASIFQVYLEQKYQIIVEITSKIILTTLIFLLIFLKTKLLYFFLLDVFIALIIVFGNRFFSRYFVKLEFSIKMDLCIKLLKESWPLVLSFLFTAIVMRLDKILLYQFKGVESVGLYSAATRIVEAFNIIPIAIGSSIFPILSKDYINSSVNKTYESSLKYISYIIVPISVFITVFSKYIILLLYGESFILTQYVLSILIWSLLWYFTGAIFGQVLVATGNQKIIPVSAGLDALFSILLNLVLIPKYGIIGASSAATISSISGRLICYIFFKNVRIYISASLKYLVKPLIYFLPPGIIIYLILH